MLWPAGGSLAIAGNRNFCSDVGDLGWFQVFLFVCLSACLFFVSSNLFVCSFVSFFIPSTAVSLLSVLLPDVFGALVCSVENTSRIEVCLIILCHFACLPNLHPCSSAWQAPL